MLLTAFGCFMVSAGLVAYNQVQEGKGPLLLRPLAHSRNLEVPVEPSTRGGPQAESTSQAPEAEAVDGSAAEVASEDGPAAEDGSITSTVASASATDPPATVITTTVAPTTACPNTSTTTAACAAPGEDCRGAQCCLSAGTACFEKNATAAFCKADCAGGPDMAEAEYSAWTCKQLGPRAAGEARPVDWELAPAPEWVKESCSPEGANCLETRCCSDGGMQCYAKHESLGWCKPSCTPGVDFEDADSEPWSCKEVGPRTPGKIPVVDTTGLPMPAWAASACASSGENCTLARCCSEPGHRCFAKGNGWASCRPECVPGPQPDDRADRPWTCEALGPMSPGVATIPKIRRGSFLVVGDWGWDEKNSGGITQDCQKNIAAAMDRKMTELGDVKFVISLGDSFYSNGVEDKKDPEWDLKWRWVYSVQLRSVAWYSVYGDHDYHKDPCACTPDDEKCAQTNYDKDDFLYFRMPGTSYFHEYPELGIELVGLDLNNFQNGADFEDENSADELMFQDCFKTACAFKCLDYMKNRTQRSLDLFYDRAKKSTQKSLVVFSHYPTDYFRAAPKFLETLSDNSTYGITYYGAHRQTIDQSGVSIEPNTNWVVGGGGGDKCKTTSTQGFVVGEIWGDSSITSTPVAVDNSACCAES